MVTEPVLHESYTVLALIPLLPFLGFLVNAFLGKRLSKAVSGTVACAAMIGAFAASVAAVWRCSGKRARSAPSR